MSKYTCKVCGWIYDENKGDNLSSPPILPQTPFDSLPNNWVCPICGAPKDKFRKIE